MSFDYPLEYDDNEAFFKITAELTLTYQSVEVPVPINQTVTIRTIEDTGIGGDNKNFAIPVNLLFPISAIERMVLKSATIEVLNRIQSICILTLRHLKQVENMLQ